MCLLYIWGHAYELDKGLENNSWEMIEHFCEVAGGHSDVWYATNIEIYDYITAMHSLRFSADRTIVKNPTDIDVFIEVDREPVVIPAGQTVKLGK